MNLRAQFYEALCTTDPTEVGEPKLDQPKSDHPLAGRLNSERGQTTAEYALVLLAAGTIAMLVVGWAQSNDAIGALFDTVLSRITSLMA